MSDSLRPYGLQPTRLICPWDFPGKCTGVGCHCLLRLKALGDAIFIGIFSIRKISIIPQYDLSIQLSTSQKFSDLLMILISSFYNVSMHAKSLQSCLTLCNAMDCSLPGSSVHDILQTRILEWASISSSRGREGSQPRGETFISCVSCIGWWVLYH